MKLELKWKGYDDTTWEDVDKVREDLEADVDEYLEKNLKENKKW